MCGGDGMAEKKQRKRRLVRTKRLGIAIGEPVKIKNGEYGLRVKKSHSEEYEVITIIELVTMIIQLADLADS